MAKKLTITVDADVYDGLHSGGRSPAHQPLPAMVAEQ
jgi:hypothetical protein